MFEEQTVERRGAGVLTATASLWNLTNQANLGKLVTGPSERGWRRLLQAAEILRDELR